MGGGDRGAARRGPGYPGGEFTPDLHPGWGLGGQQGLGGAHPGSNRGRAGAGVGGRPTPRQGGQVLGTGGSLTDLAAPGHTLDGGCPHREGRSVLSAEL